MENVWCERVFAPSKDMVELMKENDVKLFALESKDEVRSFDIIGFSLQYELSYTTMLQMLVMSGIPLRSDKRASLSPIIMIGGPCAYNCEPIADFIDLAVMGEGEEVNLEVIRLYEKAKKEGWNKERFLLAAAHIDSVYVPAFYTCEYNSDGTISSITPNKNVPETITKRIVTDLNTAYYPESFVIPFGDIVHDRVAIEVQRGCIRGCRFCQAGMLYRPMRIKDVAVLNKQAKSLCENTGYDELSLLSLSTSDYPQLNELVDRLLEWTESSGINLALPSLRVDNFSMDFMNKVQHLRKSGLTIAPEAGSARMRDIINKNVSEEDIIRACTAAFEGGFTSVKLYFMLGLPFETDDDVIEIANLAQRIVDCYYKCADRQKGKSVNVSLSVAAFIPKPFTPFQYAPQNTVEEIARKQRLLRQSISSNKIRLSTHDPDVSFLEAVFARGDRRLAPLIEYAVLNGAYLESWSEYFSLDWWNGIFEQFGIDASFYANRERKTDEIMPWKHIDIGVSDKFLISEYEKAKEAQVSPNCKEKCLGCGASRLKGGVYCANRKA